jgi:glycosyltransferase involved in cell wall biosynthesis
MISIHMTTHRRLGGGLLANAVESVLSQDFRNFEFIICDDASVDGTSDYLEAVAASDHRVRLFRNEQNVNSVAVSLGRCLTRADSTRPWVSWMFDDCVLLPGALSRLTAAIAAEPSARMIYGVTEVLQRDGGVLRVGSASLAEVRASIASSSVLVPNGGILVHREVFAKHGWYDTSIVLRRSCDWDLFRRIIEADTETLVLADVLMREHGDLQADSLRNAFTTSFGLMRRFAMARDAAGARLDLENVLLRPIDWIPPANWSVEDLDMMKYQFVEYFLSVGDVARAFRWSNLLSKRLDNRGILLRESLLRRANGALPADQRALAAGAFTGVVLGAWREQRGMT